jgi:alpha-mannosidase
VILVFAACACVCAAEEKPPVSQVIVVFKTHFDIGYTDLATNVVQRYRTTMIDQALKVVDQNRDLPPEQQFVWTIPGWPMKKILEDWPGQTPERRERVRKAFKDGRFVVHALPFSTHTELLELEDLVVGLSFSTEISQSNQQPLPRDAKMTDVPSHSWVMPTLLKHAGVDFLHLGCNAASSSPQVPRLFWWQGPDGSRLLTMYTAESYGTGLVPPKDWPYRTWLALIHTGDNHGPPTPEEVKAVLEEARTKLPGVKVRIGRLSDFADALLAEKASIPIVRGDMADTWIYGPMSDPAGARLARNTRPMITAAETLGSEMRAWGLPDPPATAVLRDARENSLLYGEHTWGGAFWWIYGRYILKFGDEWEKDHEAGRFQRIESSWDEHTAYIEKAHSAVESLLAAETKQLARCVNTSGKRIVVFNPLPWARSDLVTVQVPSGAGIPVEARTGRPLPHHLEADGKLTFLAPNVPPCGYQTFTLQRPAQPEAREISTTGLNNAVENKYFRIRVDTSRGVLLSIFDKQSGRELVETNSDFGFGQYLYERFDSNQVQSFVQAYVKIDAEWGTNELGKPSMPPATAVPYRASRPHNFLVRYEHTDVTDSAIMTAPAGAGVPHPVTTRLIVYRDQPFVDLEVTLHGKPFEPWPEAGWICLPFRVEDPTFRLGRLGSIVDPARDITPGCNFHQFALNGGMTITDRTGRGIGLCALDSPLVSLGEPGCWKYSKSFTPRKPTVFVNLFNNQWSTNFRLWNSGTWTSRVRLWSVSGKGSSEKLVRPTEEARSPLAAGFAEGPAGQLPMRQAGLSVSDPGVKVTAFRAAADGRGLLLRLWEQAGRTGTLHVTLPAGVKATSAQPVDLRDRPCGPPIPIKGKSFKAKLTGFAPASFRIE